MIQSGLVAVVVDVVTACRIDINTNGSDSPQMAGIPAIKYQYHG
jgi:hypothetical protein